MRRLLVVGAAVVLVAALAVSCAPPSSITGTVSYGTGPAASVEVTAFNSSGTPMLSTTTAADGTYTLASLTPGAYRVRVVISGWLDRTEWFGGDSFATASDVTVTADGVAVANIVIVPKTVPSTTTTVSSTTTTTSPTTTTTMATTTTTQPPVPPTLTNPMLLGSASNRLGNDPSGCASFQPDNAAPCGPQPMVWTAIHGPYYAFAQGDPYATKCARNDVNPSSTTNGDPSQCDDPSAANGAKNPLYKPGGYRYAVNVGPADIGRPLTVQGYDLGDYPRTTGASGTPDCNAGLAPFNVAPYNGTVSSLTCQTGDSGAMNIEAQVYDNDGVDNSISFNSPLNGCRAFIPEETPSVSTATTYKNKWATVCTFTPTQMGVYPLTIKSSNIAGIADDGVGINAFALRVTGGTSATSTGLRAVDDLSIYSNLPSTPARYYLADVNSSYAGRTMVVDLYDAGDGTGPADFSLQFMAPPSGAPAAVPTAGTVVPASNVVDSCQYNATPSATKGGATPDTSASCTVVTKSATTGPVYNASWLRVRIKLAPNYSCTSDCWWSIRYLFGAGGVPSDRTVWSVSFEN